MVGCVGCVCVCYLQYIEHVIWIVGWDTVDSILRIYNRDGRVCVLLKFHMVESIYHRNVRECVLSKVENIMS